MDGISEAAKDDKELYGISNGIMYDAILALICKYYLVFEVEFDFPEQLGAAGTLTFTVKFYDVVFEKEKSTLPSRNTVFGNLICKDSDKSGTTSEHIMFNDIINATH